jgi:adenine-specific DNA-methyltransferase
MVNALQPIRGLSWLEPCMGRGVFLTALAAAGIPPEEILAIDLDGEPCDEDSLGVVIREVDFLSWSQSTQDRFDRIVGNPPFVPLSRLDPALQSASGTIRVPGSDRTVPLNSNLWFAFLCGCLHLLRPGGSIAFILPAAWDYACYAAEIRERIPRLFREFFTFRSRRPMFDGIQEGAIVIIGRSYMHEHLLERRLDCPDRDHLVSSLVSIDLSSTHDAKPYPIHDTTEDIGVLLGDLLEIRLGGVTGHAKYFLLTEEQRIEFGLPTKSLQPVVSRSRHLNRARIDRRSWAALLQAGERVWLFRPIGEIAHHPAVMSYLLRFEQEDGGNRKDYKIKNRKPWYLTPLPDPVDGFLSGMTKLGPWIAFRQMEGLNASNTLYVVRFKQLPDRDAKSAIALAMLTSDVRETLRKKCRHYPDGLMKYEPGDLKSVRVPIAKDPRGASALYSKAIECLLMGDVKSVCSIADGFFSN